MADLFDIAKEKGILLENNKKKSEEKTFKKRRPWLIESESDEKKNLTDKKESFSVVENKNIKEVAKKDNLEKYTNFLSHLVNHEFTKSDLVILLFILKEIEFEPKIITGQTISKETKISITKVFKSKKKIIDAGLVQIKTKKNERFFQKSSFFI